VRVLIRTKGDRNLTLYYVDRLGKEVTKSAGTRDRREAERAAALWEQELLAFHGASGEGWGNFRRRFEDEHLATLTSKGQAAYQTALNHFERLMTPATAAVDADGVSTFKARLLAEGRRITSVANYLRHLRTAFNWAAEMGMAPKVKVKIPKQATRKFMRGRPITEAEYRLMLAACKDPALRRFIELLWYSGMRLREAEKFSWDSPPVLAQPDSKPYPTILFYSEGHKAGQDTVSPMTPELHKWLCKTPLNQRQGKVAPLPLSERIGIKSPGPVLAKEASYWITDLGEECGIVVSDDGKFASAHDLRRAYGARWAKVVRPLTLQRLMRHRDFTTTLKYYIGLDAEDAGAELWGVPNTVPKTTSKPHSAAHSGPKKRGEKQRTA